MPSVAPIQLIRSSEANPEWQYLDDLVAIEEPLEIRIGYGSSQHRQQKSLAVTMRTPNHDFELATGFLFTEGIIQDFTQINSIKYCSDQGKQAHANNIVRVELQPTVVVNWQQLDRNFYMTSSCGVCGKASIEAIAQNCPVLSPPRPILSTAILHELPKRLHQQQAVFQHTGGLHAAGLFNTEGQLHCIREDVGRHNAVDKVIGASILQNNPLNNTILLVSGRLSFELVQKALMAGIPILVAIGAPSSLAIQLAQQFQMTLIGFLRNNHFNIYAGHERIYISENHFVS